MQPEDGRTIRDAELPRHYCWVMRLGGAALLCALLGFFCITRAFTYVDAPVQLLDVSQDHSRFELVDQGLEFLRSIKAPFAIIAVGGAAKSGKSSLLNQILNVSNSVGFDGSDHS